MRCVAYCRVSTDEKEQLHSFANQRDHYLDLFLKRKDLEPAKCGMLFTKKSGKGERISNEDGIFADEGISGTKLKNREAFNYMMECAQKKLFDAVFVKNVARFSRYTVDGGEMIKRLKGWGIRVIFEDVNIDSLDPSSEMVLNMLMSVAQEESRAKSQAVKFGIRKLQEKGGWSSSVVFGYDRKDGYLVINEPEANIVNEIFTMFYKDGYGANKIARYLNAKQIPTKKNSKWTLAQIRGMLRNRLYTGVQTTHKSTNTDINVVNDKDLGVNYIQEIDTSDWIVIEKPEIKIIEKDYFEKVQLEIKKRLEDYETTGNFKGTHLLSNLIVCGHCEGAYRRKLRGRGERRGELGYYWTCGKHDTYGNDICPHRYAFIETDFVDFVKRKVIDLKQSDLSSELEAYLEMYYSFDPVKLDSLKSGLEKIDNRINTNFNLYSDGEMPKNEYLERNKMLQEEKKQIQTECNRLKNYEQEIRLAKQRYEEYVKSLNAIDVDKMDNNDIKKIFRRIIIKPWGRYIGKGKGQYISVEFDFNFLDISINQLIDDIKKKAGESEHELLDRLKYCNFEGIIMGRGKYNYFEPTEQNE